MAKLDLVNAMVGAGDESIAMRDISSGTAREITAGGGDYLYGRIYNPALLRKN